MKHKLEWYKNIIVLKLIKLEKL